MAALVTKEIKTCYKVALAWRIPERLSWGHLMKVLYHFSSSFLVMLVLYLFSLFTLLGRCLHIAIGSWGVCVC